MSLRFGKVQPAGFIPRDIRCPYCYGTGMEGGNWKATCLVCDGSGKREVALRRILSGEVLRNEQGEWSEPYEPISHPCF